MPPSPKFSCRECGNDEFMTDLNSHDIYLARDDKLYWQRTELAEGVDSVLHCCECGARAPAEFEAAME